MVNKDVHKTVQIYRLSSSAGPGFCQVEPDRVLGTAGRNFFSGRDILGSAV